MPLDKLIGEQTPNGKSLTGERKGLHEHNGPNLFTAIQVVLDF